MIKTVICYNVPGFVVVFYNRAVSYTHLTLPTN